jgi:hypothetical protein
MTVQIWYKFRQYRQAIKDESTMVLKIQNAIDWTHTQNAKFAEQCIQDAKHYDIIRFDKDDELLDRLKQRYPEKKYRKTMTEIRPEYYMVFLGGDYKARQEYFHCIHQNVDARWFPICSNS